LPLLHVAILLCTAAEQTAASAPQLLRSLLTSTQVLEVVDLTNGATHPKLQVLFMQTGLATIVAPAEAPTVELDEVEPLEPLAARPA